MSEEEKKAIEIIKKEITKPETTPLEVYVTDVKMLLHIIEKQQKEIEKLKKPKYIIDFKTNKITKLTNDFVSKNKIREILNKYAKTDVKNHVGIINFYRELKELLGE